MNPLHFSQTGHRGPVTKIATNTFVVGFLLFASNLGLAQEAPPSFKAVDPPNRSLDASLYMQTSAEYGALCYQVYNLAAERLGQAKADFAKTSGGSSTKSAAVVMDLDETVFDNSGFQAMLVRSGLAWDLRLWKVWEKDWSASVGSIPGAKEFIQKAKRSGVAVVFVSNRDKEFEQQTKDALNRLGIGYDLLKLKEADGSDDKTLRFEEVQQKYDVLMYVGDNLRDLSEEFKFNQLSENSTAAELQDAINERRHRVEGYAGKWGSAQKPIWIVLPNPTYGEWTKPLGRGVRDLDRLVPEAKSSSAMPARPFPPAPSRPTDHKFLQEGISAMAGGATTLTGWSLAILGATVAGIVAGQFLRPAAKIRLVYLLFIPGWVLLGISIWYGDKVTRRVTAAGFTDNHDRLREIAASMNSEYAAQRDFFQFALLAFGCWLGCVLLWWVFAKERSKQT